jgi:hypothetical protein
MPERTKKRLEHSALQPFHSTNNIHLLKFVVCSSSTEESVGA